MTYVMSDLHGQYDAYIEMLEKTGFSERDALYVVGDAIDRGAGGVDILMDMMDRSNIVLLRGNHEQMMLEAMAQPEPSDDDISLWLEYNGGKTTFDAYIKLEAEQRQAVLDYLWDTPVDMDLTVAGASYYLVHGCPSPVNELYSMIWDRVDPVDPAHKRDGMTVVFGHTPTPYYQNEIPWGIFFGDGIIGIDCGCASHMWQARLGCLRLDDMKAFYVAPFLR